MELDERALKFHSIANRLLEDRKFNDAIANYLKAIEIEPNYGSAYYHLAEAYEAKKLDDDAVKCYIKAIELNPSFADVHLQSGLDSLLAGPLAKAVGDYKKKKFGGGAEDKAAVKVGVPEKAVKETEKTAAAPTTPPPVQKQAVPVTPVSLPEKAETKVTPKPPAPKKTAPEIGPKPVKPEPVTPSETGMPSIVFQPLGMEEEHKITEKMPEKITLKPKVEERKSVAPSVGKQEGRGEKAGGFSTLEGMDFDAGDSLFGTSEIPIDTVEMGVADTTAVKTADAAGGGLSTYDEPEKMPGEEGQPAPSFHEIGVEERGAAQSEVVVEPPEMEALAPKPGGEGGGLVLKVEVEKIRCHAGEVIPLSVRIEDGAGGGVPDKKVKFVIEEDTANGMDSSFILPSGEAGINRYEGETDIGGEVLLTLQTSKVKGSSFVVVSCDERKKRIEVEITSAAADRVTFIPATIEVEPGTTVEIKARVMDKYGNPVAGEICEFEVAGSRGDEGMMEIQTSNLTNAGGEVKVRYTTSPQPGAEVELTVSCPSVALDMIETARLYNTGELVKGLPAEQPPIGERPQPAPPPISAPVSPPNVQPIREPERKVEPPVATTTPTVKPTIPVPKPPPPVKKVPEIDFLKDELPPRTPGAYYPEPSDFDVRDEILPPDDLAGDPLAPPKFKVTRGKKPLVEVDKVATKTSRLLLIGGAIFLILLGLYFGYRKASYSYHLMQGDRAFGTNDVEKAIFHYEICVNLNKRDAKPLASLAQIHSEKAEEYKRNNDIADFNKEITVSISYLDQVLRINPNDPDAYYDMGQAYELKGDKARAIQSYEKVIVIDPSYSSAISKLKRLKGTE